MSMSDILAALLFLLVPLRQCKADRRMAKDTFALIQDMVVVIIIIIIITIVIIIVIIITIIIMIIIIIIIIIIITQSSSNRRSSGPHINIYRIKKITVSHSKPLKCT